MEPLIHPVSWSGIADSVRRRTAEILGSDVVSATNAPGGFSPGFAGCCELRDGRRYFIKAVSTDLNPDTPVMHRREAWVTARIPHQFPVPTLIDVIDDGHWVVLVFEAIDGYEPRLPWSLAELSATFEALDQFATQATPNPIIGLESFAERHHDTFSSYRRAADSDSTVLDHWSQRNLDRLIALEAQCPAATSGDTLVHCDVRADNLLITTIRRMFLVDWPHACVGAPWVDKALLLPSVGIAGGPSPTVVEHALRPFATIDPEQLNSLIAGLAGYLTVRGAQPDPPGIPHLRSFQRAQAEIARAWLAARLGVAPPLADHS